MGAQKSAVAGIGSRNVPKEIFRLQVSLGCMMSLLGKTWNSGGAAGSDEAYELGADLAYQWFPEKVNALEADRKAIFLPWHGFRGRQANGEGVIVPKRKGAAEELARVAHPAWDNLSNAMKNLMSRNMYQILGRDLDSLVEAVYCYTKDGAQHAGETSRNTGGTGQAIRTASKYSVPVFNLGREESREKIRALLGRFDAKMVAAGVEPLSTRVNQYLDTYIEQTSEVGDLIQAADQGRFDVVVHGCNSHNTMGMGFARVLGRRWPEAKAAHATTKKGDRDKLGDYTACTVTTKAGTDLTIINGYTQQYYGTDPLTCYVDIEAVRKLLLKIKDLYGDKRVGMPLIGGGLGNVEWYTVHSVIKEAAPDMNITFMRL